MKKQITTGIIIFMLIAILAIVLWSTTVVVADHINTDYSKEELINLINETQAIKDKTHAMATNARDLGWTDNDKLIKELKDRWLEADTQQKAYQARLDEILVEEAAAAKLEEEKWAAKAAEYPVATQIWRYMKDLGWNDYVCAGIMGNLMAEVGGQTLNIRYTLSSDGYYGMCQWSRGYSQVWGAGLETQCDFLRDTIKYEIDTYGFKYQKGFNFDSFLNMTNAKKAALAFAKSYERCASGSYKVRQSNAEKAYEYFTK